MEILLVVPMAVRGFKMHILLSMITLNQWLKIARNAAYLILRTQAIAPDAILDYEMIYIINHKILYFIN